MMTYGWTINHPHLGVISPAMESATSTLKCHGINNDAFISRFEVVFCELLTNAIIHSEPQEAGPITLSLSMQDAVLSLCISNPSPWLPSTVPQLPNNSAAVSGRGLYLVKELTKSVIHNNSDGRHVCRVEMDLPIPGWSLQEEDVSKDELMEELQECYEQINGLLSMSEMLSQSYDTPSFFRMSLERLVFLTGATGALIRTLDYDKLWLRGAFPESLEKIVPQELHKDQLPEEFNALLKGESVLIDPSGNQESLQHLKSLGKTASCFPIAIKNRTLGAIILFHPDAERRFFSAAKVKVIKLVAWYSAMLLSADKLRKKKAEEQLFLQEVEIASKIQRNINTPVDLFLPGIRVQALCEPALLSGGDFFEVAPMKDGSLFAIVADVMGKGMTSTMLASSLRSAIRTLLSFETDPGRVCTKINRVLFPDLYPVDMFITTSVLLLSSDRSKISFCSAGHLPLISFTPEGIIQKYAQKHPPLGIYPDAVYHSSLVNIGKSDSILLHTDGLTDLSDQEGNYVGENFLIDCLSHRKQGTSTFSSIKDRLLLNPKLHHTDDITLILIEQVLQ